jgi:hypothetical protein
MIEQIRENINNPEILERLYQDDWKAFKADFEKIYPEIENADMARFWKARLEYGKTTLFKAGSFIFSDFVIMLIVCLITAFLIKIPDLFQLKYTDTVFYEKNAAIIVFFGLTLFSILIGKTFSHKRIFIIALAFLIPLIYINLLPSNEKSDSVNLAYIHLPLLMWCIYGIVFTGFDLKNKSNRIDFIKYNGDLAIIYALIAVAGGVLTVITIGLFNAIGIQIGNFYMENIVIIGAVCAPVVAAFIIRNYPTLTNKLAPLIASIFSPLVLITLIIFLITIIVTGKDPYNDRDFLLIFNIMLIGVMGIIVFSVSETSIIKNQKFNEVILFILSIIAVIIDLIALSAIFYRLGEYGVTPNRLAILVSNILILANLVLIMIDLFRINFKKKEFRIVEMSDAKFLPVYLVWIFIVIFGFPLIFGMK